MVEAGEINLGEEVVPRIVQRMRLNRNSGQLEEQTEVVSSRMKGLREVLYEHLLNIKHLLRPTAPAIETTVWICMWHDHSDLSGKTSSFIPTRHAYSVLCTP